MYPRSYFTLASSGSIGKEAADNHIHLATINTVRDHAAAEFLCRMLNEVKCMGLLPDTKDCGLRSAGDAWNVFRDTVGQRSRHVSRHVRDARAAMRAEIAN